MSVLLPGKHIAVTESLVHQAALLHDQLPYAVPVARAWASCVDLFAPISFSRFILMLDTLYAVNLIDYRDGLLFKEAAIRAS